MGKIKLTDAELKKKRKETLIQTCIFVDFTIIYFCMLFGYGIVKNPGDTALSAILDVMGNFPRNFYQVLPTKFGMIFAGIIICALVDVLMYDSYQRKKDIVKNPNGDAAFEEDFMSYDKEFVIDPAIVEKATGEKPKTYYDDEHKKIVTTPKIKNNLKDKVYKECWFQTQLYADKVALSLNGSWAQRNSNAMIFGASGSGKSRYFLNPNLLQANSNYVVTDPSGEIMLGYGAFLQKEKGYIVKCLNISDMEHSCRFNPLQYIKDASDIPVIVTTLMENTQKKEGGGGGDGDFWTKTTQALLCAIIGYLYEVEPLERRNFYNVLEMLRMAQEDEDAQDQEATDFDRMFEVLGRKNPNSYAFHQYQTYSLAPRKTALNILISTAVLLSTFIDIPEFNNLTYKDEMELDKFGAAPYKLKEGATLFLEDEQRYEERYKSGSLPKGYIDVEDFKKYKDLLERDGRGRYVEGDPYKMAVFLCIPTADTTYNWLTAMMYSIVFKLIYRRGETRAKEQVMPNPRLAFPARLLIDECANIGKIPNLQEYLATCRKYAISIVPIFQSFSQIQKVYGKEDANSIYANCDTTLFLGGVDSETLKIVCDRLGKESVKALSTGTSGGGKSKSNSTNVQNVGRELMSRIQVEQMSNAECLVFIRALKPFKVRKFNLNGHPNYKFTAEADPDGHSFVNPFWCEYDDLAIENIRIKKVGEIGYNEPREINSARLRASKQQASEARRENVLSLQRAAAQYGKYDPSAYDTEAERKEAKANNEAYIAALRAAWIEGEREGDSYIMDVVRSTCMRYDVDIGMDIGVSRREDPRARSVGKIDKYNDDEIDETELLMRELSESEAVERMKTSATLGNTIISGISHEFDIATLSAISANIGGMIKDVPKELNKIYNETNKISPEERVANEPEEKGSDELDIESNIKVDEETEVKEDYIVELDIDDSDFDGDDVKAIEEVIENQRIKKALNDKEEGDEEVVEDDSLETVPPTDEELQAAINESVDFVGADESGDDYYDYTYETDEELSIDIESGSDDEYNDSDNEIHEKDEDEINPQTTQEEVQTEILNEGYQLKIESDESSLTVEEDTQENSTETDLSQENEPQVIKNESLNEKKEEIKTSSPRPNKWSVFLDDDDDDDFTI